MRTFFASVLLVSLGWLVAGCEVCGISSEPTLDLNINAATNEKRPFFKKIWVLGSPKDTIAGRQFSRLPLNLNANSTTYIFEQASRTDTLTVFYTKKVFNASKNCGYVLDLEAPRTGLTHKSTFKEVQIGYSPFYGFRGWSSQPGLVRANIFIR